MKALILPIVAGAAVAAGLAYLYTTEDGAQKREKWGNSLKERFPEAGERFAELREKLMGTFTHGHGADETEAVN